MRSAEWKRFYAAERAGMGEHGLLGLLDRAGALHLDPGDAVVFPHTRLADSGTLIAAAAKAVIASGNETVLALGVMHGARERDADLVKRARSGDRLALATLRRVHGPDISGDDGFWQEEFSLDNFRALLELAARRAGRKMPRVIERYPFMTNADPASLLGIDELRDLVGSGCAIVATADPMHHGHGYDTPKERCMPLESPDTLASSREIVAEGFASLCGRDYAGFARHCRTHASDFRDNGPVLRELLGEGPVRADIVDFTLVDYSATLASQAPTWVAAALAKFEA